MKIVYVYDALALYGGIERILIEKMNYLSQLPNYQIYIITTNQGNHPISFPLLPEVEHIDLNIRFHTKYQYKLLRRLYYSHKLNKRFKKRLKECIDKINPDIIVATTTHFANTIIKLPCNAKKVIECHAYKNETKESKSYICTKIKKHLLKKKEKLIKKADALIVLTQNSANDWKSIKSAIIIPNIIQKHENVTSSLSNKRVICVGRLEYEKGIDLLIETWKYVTQKHPDWSLDIFGDGSMKQEIIHKINIWNMTNTITIHEPTPQIYNEYSKSSIYVLSSRFEGFGLVLAEAMSCGLPCIAFNCPNGPANIIQDNEDGLLVENGNIKQLSEKICYLIEHENIRKTMGLKAQQNIQRFYPENIMPKWNELFENIVTNTET